MSADPADELLAGHLWMAFRFLAACELQIRADELLTEALRLEAKGFNLPWARNRRRESRRIRFQARRLYPSAYEGDYDLLPESEKPTPYRAPEGIT